MTSPVAMPSLHARPRSLAAALAAAALVASVTSPARADDPPAKLAVAPSADLIAQARTHFERAVKLYGEDDFRAALIEFNRAYELAPNWSVLYNIGQSYYQLRDYPNAVGTLEKYVAQGGKAIPPDRRAQVDREIVELQGRVAHVTLHVSSPGAEVTLDDVPVGTSPITTATLVGAGRHTFRAEKVGFPPETKIVDVAGGDNLTVTLTFAAPTPGAVVPTTPVVAPPPAKPNYTPAIATLVVGGVGLAVGAVFGGLAIGNKSSLQGECKGTACPPSASGDVDSFNRNTTASTVGFAVGGAVVVAGVVLLVTAKGQPAAPAPAAGLSIRPWVGPGAGGVSGSF